MVRLNSAEIDLRGKVTTMYLNKMHVDPSGSATVYPEPSGKNDLYRFVDLSVWLRLSLCTRRRTEADIRSPPISAGSLLISPVRFYIFCENYLGRDSPRTAARTVDVGFAFLVL